jgi:hypothetical protein
MAFERAWGSSQKIKEPTWRLLKEITGKQLSVPVSHKRWMAI